jgi:ribonuclease Y
MDTLDILLILAAAIVAFVIGFFVRKSIAEAKISSAEEEAKKILETTFREAEAQKKEIIIEAKDEAYRIKSDADKDYRERQAEAQRLERRLLQKEETIDKKVEVLDKREESLIEKEKTISETQVEVNKVLQEQIVELERISGLSMDNAKKIILETVEHEVRHETAMLIKELETAALDEADKKAKEIISTAISRCAADHVTETTVSVIALPNDEMKGRIIGREGRNIRTLESLTGIDLIIDDTPEAVILSGFDPIRREVAKVALERLVNDGRIHPARIEETVLKARKDVDEKIREYGEQATFEVGIHNLHPDLIKILGRLRFRTSYGQNALLHATEVSHLAGLMAAELGEDVKLAKRAGLLHDIGKAIDHEVEGSHVEIGVELAKKYNEHPVVINSIASHHGDIEPNSIISVLIGAADALSAARPGARRETLENYIKRLEKLEEISNSFAGVEKSFAIQAGREVRIMVNPEDITDADSILLARDITKKIENELDYPGNIKVTVIRETRAIEYAK